MNVFISWSGEESKAYAEIMRGWLPNVIQALNPFYSPEDVKAGTRWSAEIAQKLQATKIGILCLTRDNLNAPWLMFEAGALSKQLEARVCPVLFRLKPIDVQGPLTQFQLNEFSPDGIYAVLVSINEQLKPNSLSPQTLKNVFAKWWPELEANVNRIVLKHSSVSIKSTRTERDLIEEILIRIRASTVEQPLDVDMIKLLMDCYARLAKVTRYVADPTKRDSAALWNLQFPIQYLITRISDTNKRRDLAAAYADTVSVIFQGSGDVDKEKLVEYLVHPSHGLIIAAPIIPKTNPQRGASGAGPQANL